MCTGEGGAIEAEYQAKYTFDRVETTSTIWLGLTMTCARCHTHKYDPIQHREYCVEAVVLTMTCARCHTHKYDPIQHREYYGLYALFNNLDESIMDGNRPNPDPFIKLPSREQADRQEWLKKRIDDGQKKSEAPTPDLDAAQVEWAGKWHA